MTSPRPPKPFWRHLLGASGLAAIVVAAVAVSKLVTWAVGEAWGTAAILVFAVLVIATINWSADRKRRGRAQGGEVRPRPPAEPRDPLGPIG